MWDWIFATAAAFIRYQTPQVNLITGIARNHVNGQIAKRYLCVGLNLRHLRNQNGVHDPRLSPSVSLR